MKTDYLPYNIHDLQSFVDDVQTWIPCVVFMKDAAGIPGTVLSDVVIYVFNSQSCTKF